MLLHKLFPPEYIKVDLEAATRDEAFNELAEQLCKAGKLDCREAVVSAITEREAKMSTGILKGIAVPHGKTSAVQSICGVLGISRRGIDYDALDGEPVYILFMVAAPPEETEQHLLILKRMAELLENPQFQIDLQSQADSQGVHAIIRKYEKGKSS